MPRQTKTPTQRAEEALAVLERQEQRAERKAHQARVALEAAETDLAEIRARLRYAADDPALPDDRRKQVHTHLDNVTDETADD